MRKTPNDPVYRKLIITASSPITDIWLGDDDCHLVQKETGTLETSIMEGRYTVEFGLGTPKYPIHVTQDVRYTEAQLREGFHIPSANSRKSAKSFG